MKQPFKDGSGRAENAAGHAADPEALFELYTLYNENTEKLRLAFERLEKRFREIDPYNIYGSITDALITLDLDERVLTLNPAAERVFRVSEKDALGERFAEIVPQCAEAFVRYRRSGCEDRGEIAFTRDNGERVCLRGRFSPLLDRRGEIIGTTCLFADLSLERLLEEKARRSDRLAALGELAAGVAHEMRNPLTTVRGYLQILPGNAGDAEFIEEFSENLIREIDRLTRLTENLLNMAKPISPELEREDLAAIIDDVVLFHAERLEKHGIRTGFEDAGRPLPVLVDRGRVKQVFINILVNAIEAMEGGGALTVRLSARVEKLEEDRAPAAYAVAEIQDSGPGIPANCLERLFDPFYTTKDHGTGLGLALSNRIIEEHGGFLRAESEPGAGACFWVMLPLAEPAGDAPARGIREEGQ